MHLAAEEGLEAVVGALGLRVLGGLGRHTHAARLGVVQWGNGAMVQWWNGQHWWYGGMVEWWNA